MRDTSVTLSTAHNNASKWNNAALENMLCVVITSPTFYDKRSVFNEDAAPNIEGMSMTLLTDNCDVSASKDEAH